MAVTKIGYNYKTYKQKLTLKRKRESKMNTLKGTKNKQLAKIKFTRG